MLVAVALIVSGIVINWGIGFTETKRSEVQFCSGADIVIEKAYYDEDTGDTRLIIRNSGKVPLKGFNVLLYYENGTAESPEGQYSDYEIQPDDIITFQVSVDPFFRELIVQSRQCKKAQNAVLVYDIEGF